MSELITLEQLKQLEQSKQVWKDEINTTLNSIENEHIYIKNNTVYEKKDSIPNLIKLIYGANYKNLLQYLTSIYERQIGIKYMPLTVKGFENNLDIEYKYLFPNRNEPMEKKTMWYVHLQLPIPNIPPTPFSYVTQYVNTTDSIENNFYSVMKCIDDVSVERTLEEITHIIKNIYQLPTLISSKSSYRYFEKDIATLLSYSEIYMDRLTITEVSCDSEDIFVSLKYQYCKEQISLNHISLTEVVTLILNKCKSIEKTILSENTNQLSLAKAVYLMKKTFSKLPFVTMNTGITYTDISETKIQYYTIVVQLDNSLVLIIKFNSDNHSISYRLYDSNLPNYILLQEKYVAEQPITLETVIKEVEEITGKVKVMYELLG